MKTSFTYREALPFFYFLSLLSYRSNAQTPPYPPVGEIPPRLELEKVIQGPSMGDLQLDKLKGKVVVIEFWATWCMPCLGAFPHLNELTEKYKDKGVVFISVSVDKGADASEKVEQLLKKKPLNSYVVLDKDGASQKKYAATTIPTTFLIDKEGKLDAVTYPTFVKDENLDNLPFSPVSSIINLLEKDSNNFISSLNW